MTNTLHCTERNGKFRCPSKNGFINDTDNRCISGVCGWDFNFTVITSNVVCVRQLNTIFDFI